MESSEFIKLLIAAVVGSLLKEFVSWLIGFCKVSLFGPMWNHSKSVLGYAFAAIFYAVLLARFGTADGPATKFDVLLMMGCGFGLVLSTILLLVSIAKWQIRREEKDAEPTAT